jgi:hypothetical protein
MAINALWIRTVTTLPVLKAAALAGQRPQGVKLRIRQQMVNMVASATHTLSTQEKPVAQIGLFQSFD